jgi:beta-glucosidase
MADVEALLAALSLEEKAALTAGEDLWTTVAIERVGIPKVRLSDGPAGARGATHFGGHAAPSTCIPCGSAIGASWDPDLTEGLAAILGREARDRGCRVLLAPTVNLHRNVLAGRNFECHSEDPLLSGKLAAAYVRGVQSAGVIATVKHFVANDSEFERGTISSVVDDRSLRELYLLPFEIAVKEGDALGIMSSYNRVNGLWVPQQSKLLLDLLRGEWGFQGLVVSDWFAMVDTKRSAGAGLDLEMPGPARAMGEHLRKAVEAGDVDEADVDGAVRRLLSAFDRVGILDEPTPPEQPQPPADEDVALVRRAAAASTVLLRNDGLLPLDRAAVRRVAVIGMPAVEPRIMGGGSAEVTPHRLVPPLDALRDALGPDVAVVHHRGCDIDLTPRALGAPGLRAPAGFELQVFTGAELDGEVHRQEELRELRFVNTEPPGRTWSARISGTIVPDETGTYRFALSQLGATRVLVDDEVVLDGVGDPPPPGGTEFWGYASQDGFGDIELEAGVPAEVVVELRTAEDALFGAVRVGFRPPEHPDLLQRAAAVAAEADVAVVMVGTSNEWESESRDRASFQLPGEQDELVRRVAAANDRTVVIVNAGSPVDLPWSEDVAAVLQCWFGGQEMGPALADVLIGAAEPGGRLPTTIPVRIEHSPSWDNYPGENGEVRYGEGLFMGYRGYEHRCLPTRFPFGHGLGYTTFSMGKPSLSSQTFRPGGSLVVSVPVTNTGSRAGSEVVQLYIAPGDARLARPHKELKAFRKVTLDPGESTLVDLVLDDRSFAYWDPGQADWLEVEHLVETMTGVTPDAPQERRPAGWQLDAGTYELLVGRSSVDIVARAEVSVVDMPTSAARSS